jgi:hypothetical protein
LGLQRLHGAFRQNGSYEVTFDNHFSGVVQRDSNVAVSATLVATDQTTVGQHFIAFGDGVHQVFMFFGALLLWAQDHEVKIRPNTTSIRIRDIGLPCAGAPLLLPHQK